MKQLKFEWNVLNYNFNAKKIEFYNIFNNTHVNENTNKLCVDYKKKKMSFDNFVDELDCIIKWQEWSRCEYEISVGSIFENDCTNLKKFDCYDQAHANIRIIAKYVLEEYYPQMKIKLEVPEINV